jgi:hypothetical protein
MGTRSIEQQAFAAARAIAARHGVSPDQAAIIHSGSNVLVHLLPAPIVARVMTGTVALHDDPERWLGREVSVLSFLAPSGTAVRPSSAIAPGPYHEDGLWMTFWEWVAHERYLGLHHDAQRLGLALRDLHEALSTFTGELGDLIEVWHDIERLHRELRPTDALGPTAIDSLHERLRALRVRVFEATLPVQALHGDVSLSNLLDADGRLVWSDFEDTFRGPVHWDVASYVTSLRDRGADARFVTRVLDAYGWTDQRALAPFVEAQEVYGKIWRLYDAQRRRA